MEFYSIKAVRIIVYHHGKLLLLKRSDSDNTDPGLWDLPGGSMQPGENISDTLKREITEEIGVSGEDILINKPVGIVFGNYHKTGDMVVAIYLCETSSNKIILNEEHSQYCWVKSEELSTFKLGRVIESVKSSLQNLI